MNFYNIRDSAGRFKKVTPTNYSIVPGRLYGFRGIVVRARNTSECINGRIKRLVTFHKIPMGFVDERELYCVTKADVRQYLLYADRRSYV